MTVRSVVVAVATLVVAIGAFVLVGRGEAQPPSEEVHLCVARNGNVRVVDPDTACGNRHTRQIINSAGPAGPEGPQGPPGVAPESDDLLECYESIDEQTVGACLVDSALP